MDTRPDRERDIGTTDRAPGAATDSPAGDAEAVLEDATDGASDGPRRGPIGAPPRRRDWHARNALHDPPAAKLEINRNPAIPDELLDQDRREALTRDDTPTEELRRVARSGWRRLLQVGMVLFALAIGYYFVSLWQVYSAGRGDQARAVDAIVVMGAAQYDGRPSPQLAARLDHVVSIWPDGHAPLVIVTGGNQPGDRFTEAEASQQYLVERGIPAEAIVLENVGATSFDSLRRVAAILNGRTGTTESSVLVVTDPYHTLRSRLIAQEVGLTAYASPTDTSVVTGARSLERHLWEAGGVSIGRVTGFEWLADVTD